jgi:hypothetical protein
VYNLCYSEGVQNVYLLIAPSNVLDSITRGLIAVKRFVIVKGRPIQHVSVRRQYRLPVSHVWSFMLHANGIIHMRNLTLRQVDATCSVPERQ